MNTFIILLFSILAWSKTESEPVLKSVVTHVVKNQLATVSHPESRHLSLGESVCLLNDSDHHDDIPACGYVVVTAKNGAIVTFLDPVDGLETERVMVPNKKPPASATLQMAQAKKLADGLFWRDTIDLMQQLFAN